MKESIFIHSLFRSGSTYIFNVFRRSDRNYCCYYEPLNEWMTFASSDPEKLLQLKEPEYLQWRHPKLQSPYFYESYLLSKDIGPLFRKEFSYDQFFSREENDINDLKAYFSTLINGAQGTAVFECCRSVGRVAQIRQAIGGKHIFLWRNPWDQWWSYKQLDFDQNNLFIINSAYLPPFLEAIKKELEVLEFHDTDIWKEHYFYNQPWLDAAGSYKLFYALWCYVMLEAKSHCDTAINIEGLSVSDAYRSEVIEELASLGVDGLSFSDCRIPIGSYGPDDASFFTEIENDVHKLLLRHEYSQNQLDDLIRLRQKFDFTSDEKDARLKNSARDAERARILARKYATGLASQFRVIMGKDNEIKQLIMDINTIHDSTSWRITAPLRNLADQIRKFRKWIS